MATKTVTCTYEGIVSGYNGYGDTSYDAGRYNDNIFGSVGTSAGTRYYACVLKFKTPVFNGTSSQINLKAWLTARYGSGIQRFNYAICSSDLNRNSYYGYEAAKDGIVEDIYQIQASNGVESNLINFGNFNISSDGITGDTYQRDGYITTDKLQSNTIYYLMIWHGAEGTALYFQDTTYAGDPIIQLTYEETQGPDHVHKYEETIIPATCTQRGYSIFTCSCGDSYIDKYTNILGHNWNSGAISVQPTVESGGEKKYTCLRCGIFYQVPLSKIGALAQLYPTVSILRRDEEKKYVPHIYNESDKTWGKYGPYISEDTVFNSYY